MTKTLCLASTLTLALLAGCGGSDGSAPSASSKRLAPQRKASAADYQNIVQDLYVAYFGRPADPGGLANFENALQAAGAPTDLTSLAQAYGGNSQIKSLIDSFGTSHESQTLYGSGNTEDFVTAVFKNVLGRAPASGGLGYWSGAIDSGSLSVGDAALSIMAGAQTNQSTQGMADAQLIANRISVATMFSSAVSSQGASLSYSGQIAAATARAMLSEVTAATDTTAFAGTVSATVTGLADTTTGYANAPTPMSASAATWTAQNNPLCTTLTPYYWEIGDGSGAGIAASETGSGNTPVTSGTVFSIASASKWVYSTTVVQMRGGASQLTASDVNFLHFTSGYTNMGNYTPGSPSCPQTSTVNQCLAQGNFATQDPNTEGKFDYDSGHMEVHASQNGFGNDGDRLLAQAVQAQIGSDINIAYSQPLLAGGIYTSAGDYTLMLRKILNNVLTMYGALGTNAVCTSMKSPCSAPYSPIPEAWHYSIGHWVEDDPATDGDGAFSSAGAFGFYPWIDSGKKYYGVISREDVASAAKGEQAGYASAQCGRLIRHAWMTGVNQSNSLPNLPGT
jgi:hypothetical protein